MKSLKLTFFLLLGTAGLAQPDQDCKLWGLASGGGSGDWGTVFSYDINADTLERHATFSFTAYGAWPQGSLLLASDGLFYGACWAGGTGMWSQTGTSCNGCGTFFSIDPSNDSLAKLFDFDYDSGPGGLPYGGPIQASNGKLYGLTYTSGQGGALYEYDPQTRVMNTARPCNSADGYGGRGSLLEGNNGLLYGMTEGGGANNLGVIFSYDPGNGTYAKLLDFNGTNGSKPTGELIQGNDSLLYGITPNGGPNNHGILFSFNVATNTCTMLYDFFYSAGGYCPQGSLLQASNGKLYGLCSKGGAFGYGTLFEFDIPSATFYNKFDFSYSNGKIPEGSLMQASNGKLYGVTSLGGASSVGVLFEYDLATSTYTKKTDFSLAVGARPKYIRLVERCTAITETLVVTAPNIFTPNGDGINDMWMPIIQYQNLLKEMKFIIYNRWGTKVFEGDRNNGWNGSSMGQSCSDGTYYYLLQYTDYYGKSHTAKGFLSLTR